MKTSVISAVLLAIAFAPATSANASELKQESKGKYALVNGLKMYYEIHGSGKPLILLHGAFATADGWGGVLPTLSKSHQVIAVELQGHGHTADRDTPFSMEQMADDVAELLKALKIETADVFGYSMGGSVALGVAIRHPEVVGKLAVLGATAGPTKDTYNPETLKQMKSITPANFNFPQLKDPYTKVAPDPSKWPVLVAKVVKLNVDFNGFSEKDIKSIKALTLIMQGDRDGVRPEHGVEMYRLIPNAQLAIFPAGDHFVLFMSPDKILATLVPFLDGKAGQGAR
jgi:pimeloyl-ACP methyl ester carboxylesterase